MYFLPYFQGSLTTENNKKDVSALEYG